MPNNTEEHSLNTEPPRRSRGWNLEPYHWKPGFCPNPGGRGKGNVSLQKALLRKIRENPALLDDVIDTLLAKARQGDGRSISLLHEMTSEERGGPLAAVQVNFGGRFNESFGTVAEPPRDELDKILLSRVVDLAICEPERFRAALSPEERATIVSALTEPAVEVTPAKSV